MHKPNEETIIAEGFAILASTAIEMGEAASVVREKLVNEWERFGRPENAFSNAARAFASLPQPLVESAEETERNEGIREMLGVMSAEEQIVSQLAAREVLESLAAEFE